MSVALPSNGTKRHPSAKSDDGTQRERFYLAGGILLFMVVVLIVILSLEREVAPGPAVRKVISYSAHRNRSSAPSPAPSPTNRNYESSQLFLSHCVDFILSRLGPNYPPDLDFNRYAAHLLDGDWRPPVTAIARSIEPPRVQVGVICLSERSLYPFFASVTSMLLHASVPLHFHLFVDSDTKPSILRWHEQHNSSFPQPFVISFYDLETIRWKIDWGVDKFGGGGTGTIIKAYPEKVLPKNVTKIIFSDTDTIWVRDIYELWKVFDTMNPEQLYGMAIEWSFWYWVRFPNLRFSQDATGLPAPRCGLNAGLLLLHVERMRAWNWTENWRVQVTEQLTMGDQDVYNGMANQNPQIYKLLPWGWNLQLWPFMPEQHKVGAFEIAEAGMIHGMNSKWTLTRFRVFWDLYSPLLLDTVREAHNGCEKPLQYLRRQGRNMTIWMLKQPSWHPPPLGSAPPAWA